MNIHVSKTAEQKVLEFYTEVRITFSFRRKICIVRIYTRKGRRFENIAWGMDDLFSV